MTEETNDCLECGRRPGDCLCGTEDLENLEDLESLEDIDELDDDDVPDLDDDL